MFCWESQDTAACALPSGLGYLVDSAEIENNYNMQGAKKASMYMYTANNVKILKSVTLAPSPAVAPSSSLTIAI